MSDIITVVCSFPRSGSSLMMKMLHEGGMPVFCENYQSYETQRQFDLPHRSDWMERCRGKAVKILDIHQHRPPKTERYRFIHMVRNTRDQTESIEKFTRLMTGLTWDKHGFRKMQRSLKRDRETVRQLLPRYKGSMVLEVKFSELVTQPSVAAQQVARFCDCDLDVAKMVAVVIPRDPAALGGAIEVLQMRDACKP